MKSKHPAHALTAMILVLGLSLIPAAVQAGSTLYMIQEDYALRDILLKYEDGTLTEVGPIGFRDVRGLAFDGTTGILYGVSRDSSRLITIDPDTGAGTVVGTDYFLPPGSNTAEISVSAGGELFGQGHLYDQTAVDTLLAVDKATGVATTVGSFGLDLLFGLAFDHADGALYGTNYDGDLYTIDTAGGATTWLGRITGASGTVARIAFDQETGILHGITTRNQLVTVDLDSLVATGVAQFPTSAQIYALDFTSPAAVFTLDVDGGYEGGTLFLDFTVGTPVDATWANYLITTYSGIQIIPLWTVPLPVIDPPREIPISFPLPHIGWIGIWTGLFTADGAQATDLFVVDTGTP